MHMWFERIARTVSGKTAIVGVSIFLHFLWAHSHTGTPNEPHKEKHELESNL